MQHALSCGFVDPFHSLGDSLGGVLARIGGLQPGELIIVAARPSMGKTALALNIARNAALDHGKKVGIFSLEMTKRSLILRLIASEARVNFTNFRKGYGNHVFASLRALVIAIQQNKSVVLGLDDKTRELNTPHLRYHDASVWTLDALRRKYVLCRCAPASVRGSRPPGSWKWPSS